jgi:hypothetical protein
MPVDCRAAELADAVYFAADADRGFRLRPTIGQEWGNGPVHSTLVVRAGDRRERIPVPAPLTEPDVGLLFAAVALPGSLRLADVLGELGIAVQ